MNEKYYNYHELVIELILKEIRETVPLFKKEEFVKKHVSEYHMEQNETDMVIQAVLNRL